ncbi:MAG: PIG-L deacetylase family protein [Candidatus Latescibacteria bacterium]|nr:PIG-L deacetylase family protein [Candidatus Latescibacterota bacterium]
MAEPLRLVSIGAHPADVFDQSGGTMAHHAARGDHVSAVVLTHGARVHDQVISDSMFHRDEVPEGSELEAVMRERSDVKADEVRRACKILGVEDIHFFGADDAVLLVEDDTVRRLASLLREIRPDIILTHFPKEGDGLTGAHAVTGQIVMRAVALASSVDPGDRRPPRRVAQVFYFGSGAASIPRNVWESRGGYYNDVFVDITDVVEKKLAALDCLVSQGYGGSYARKRIETSDGAFGSRARCAYAEGFIKLNAETHYHLPLTDHAFKVSRSSDHEIMAMYSHRIPVD